MGATKVLPYKVRMLFVNHKWTRDFHCLNIGIRYVIVTLSNFWFFLMIELFELDIRRSNSFQK